MRKAILSTLVVALLLGTGLLGAGLLGAVAIPAADSKPMAVVSFSGYDEWLGDIELVGRISGNPDLAKGLEVMLKLFTHNRGLAGLDKTRPWGIVTQADGADVTGYAFVPVTDLEQLLGVLEPFVGRAEPLEDGVYKVPMKGPKHRPLFVKQQEHGWAVIADRRERLDLAPADPLLVLGDLPEHYDLAGRIYVGNLPSAMREQFVAKAKADAERDLKRRPGEDELEYAVRKMVGEEVLRALTTTVGDLEHVTIGWALDHDTEKSWLDVKVVAKPDTETARQFARLRHAKTRFGGFRIPGAAVTGSWVRELSDRESSTITTIMETIHAKAMKDIDGKAQSAEKTETEKHVAGGLIDLIKETIGEARIEGAVALMLKSEAATVVAGGFVAHGSDLDELFKYTFKKAQAENPEIADWVKLDADSDNGVQFHVISIPVPDDAENRDKVVEMIGPTLEVVVGIGEKSVYVAAGRDAMKTLKQAIRASVDGDSEDGRDDTAPPLRWSIALGPIARFVAEMGEEKDRAKAAAIASVLEKAAGKDHIHLVLTPIERGVRIRLDVEEGILSAIGAASQGFAATPMAGGGSGSSHK